MSKDRSYIFHAYTSSLCSTCLAVIPTKVVLENGRVYLLKNCPSHGNQKELLEEDAAYYLNRYRFDKPGTPCATQTMIDKGCPFDCGLCPDHEQHTCIGLIEITEKCNLGCPLCYASSGQGASLDLPTIERMLDFFQASEGGQAEILQISGGEPTVHPQILEVIRAAKQRGIKHIMLNTNGLRIATDEKFVEALTEFSGGFEIYLQFDGLEEATYEHLRGRPLLETKRQAVANLAKHGIPITLVATVQQGVNDHELGAIIRFALAEPMVRGINFQPVAYFGRYRVSPTENRVTLTGVLQRIEAQTQMLRMSDFIPLPCDTERVAVTFLYRKGEDFIPLLRDKAFEKYLPLINNTFHFHAKEILKDTAQRLITGNEVCSCFNFLRDIKPLVPPLQMAKRSQKQREVFVNENTFRISVTSFIDRYNFEMKAMKKECVHVITPDLKKIPFSSFNMIHRRRYGIAPESHA